MQVETRKLSYERVQLPGPTSFAVRDIRLPYFPFFWHYHPEYELCLIVRGRGNRLIGDSLGSFRSGDFVFVGTNVPHTWQTKAEDGDVHALVVQFSPELWGESFLSLPEVRRLKRLLFDRAKRAFRIRGPLANNIVSDLQQLFAHPAGSLKRVTTLLLLLEKMIEPRVLEPICSVCSGIDLPAHRHDMLNQALNLIHKSDGSCVSHAQIAQSVGASPSTLSRLFRRGIGRTFVEYINDVRINRSCRALIETEQSVSEIAFASGFENLSNFNRRFRLLKGLTPKEYRRIGRD